MNEKIRELFNSLIKNDKGAASNNFASIMKNKLNDALEIRKVGITSKIFNKVEVQESKDIHINEATNADLEKVIDVAIKNGGKRNGNTVNFGKNSQITFSIENGKIKFDGGKASDIEYFNNVKDAIATLNIGLQD